MNENFLRQYRQSLILGAVQTAERLFPGERLKVVHSILDGVYCELTGSLLSSREVKVIEHELRTWVNRDIPITCSLDEGGFFHCSFQDTDINSLYSTFGSSGGLKLFQLIHFPPGFILLFPDPNEPDQLPAFVAPEKLSATFSEAQRWLENLHLAEVADVNSIVKDNRSRYLISLAEALHEKKISLIADQIHAQKEHVRVVLIAGPSSSGKTTFAHRLATQLRVNGLRPVALSLDNYFLPREQTPRDEFGQLDFEAFEALDLPLLDRHLKALIEGEAVETPLFDFVSGQRLPEGRNIQLTRNDVLLVEGIHALNPRLLPSLDRRQLFKIYVSALFQLNIDSYNRVPTTDVRLIRRLVRDDQFRGIDPERTLGQWSSVRRGENRNIFPFQEEADIMFDSSLLYELNSLRPYAEPLLVSIGPDSPHLETARHLLRLLSFFTPLESKKIPYNSILREFIGDSIYSS